MSNDRLPPAGKFPVPAALLAAFVLTTLFGLPATPAPKSAPASQTIPGRFGDYPAIGQTFYDSWVRTSVYVKMRDGVNLAIDILRPANKGIIETKPLPALWTHTRYRRASVVGGKIYSSLQAPNTLAFLKRGYVLAAVDVRGSGASFGVSRGIFTPEESGDAYEITEWLARQSWCDGKIGMFGGSYLGITQLMAAAKKPPHLKAIVPMVALFDIYDFGTPGGVFRDDLIRTWSDLTRQLDLQPGAAPVDADKDGRLLKAAMAGHKKNSALIDIVGPLRFRDDKDAVTGTAINLEWQPASFIREINASGVAIYIFGGWFDSFTSDQFLLWRNLTVPKRLTIGAWSHSPKDKDMVKEEMVLLTIESLRWYDYWLKGIDTGVLNEPPVTYQIMKGPKVNEWKTAATWPISEAKPAEFRLGAGKSGSIASINDGRLSLKISNPGQDEYKVDATTTSGTTTRWDNVVGGGYGYPDMAANDKKALTYTTPALTADMEATGHPVVRLWVSSTAPDADLFAYLEEVDAAGVSTYVTEGVIRASMRAVSPAPYDNMGLPYHRGFAADLRGLMPGEPVELVFEMEPTSTIFNARNRLRLTITGADKDNALTPIPDPAPTITIHRGKEYPSALILPVAGPVEMAEPSAKTALYLALFVTLAVLALVFAFTFFLRRRIVTKT